MANRIYHEKSGLWNYYNWEKYLKKLVSELCKNIAITMGALKKIECKHIQYGARVYLFFHKNNN